MNSFNPALMDTSPLSSALQLYIPDMRCTACAGRIEAAIATVAPRASVSTNATRQLVAVDLPGSVAVADVLDAIEAAGYSPTPTQSDQIEESWKLLRRDHLKRIGVAGIAMMQVMMVSIAGYLAGPNGMDPILVQVFRWSGLLFCLPVVGYAALPFFRNAVGSVRHVLNRSNRAGLAMDVPVAVAIATAFTASVYATLTQSGETYFDSVAMFTFLLLSARFLEQSLRGRLSRMDGLLGLLPDQVERLTVHGTETIRHTRIEADDRLRVKPGQRIPADGAVTDGETEVDEAVLTGESAPQLRRTGDHVFAGTLNLAQPITIRAQGPANESRLGTLQDLALRAEADKPPVVQFTDRIAELFVFGVLIVAAATFVAWQWIDPTRAIWVTVAVLVVSCPCALSLATPTVVTAATVALRRCGFVITRPHLLERLAETTDVVFDKTGTLTTGNTEIADVEPVGADREESLEIAAALESHFDHPYATAFRDIPLLHQDLKDVRLVPGGGIEGCLDGTTLRLGHPGFCGVPGTTDDADTTELCLTRDGHLLARFRLRQALRPETAETLDAIRSQGLQIHIVSGDAEAATRSIATRLNTEAYQAGVSPEGKLELLATLQDSGRSTLMVGDGINDVPGLAAASVSIAPLDATDLAKQRSDALLLSRSLRPLASALRISHRARRIIRQNLSWALLYNVAAIPAAASGLVPPWVAALGMSASSLLVTLNAARLARHGRGEPVPRAGPVLSEETSSEEKPPPGRTVAWKA